MLDCLIIGAGPAGLTAAVYLARFRRTVRVVDGGNSRARLIPLSRNVPGFPDGIHGESFLARLRSQLEPYGVPVSEGYLQSLWIENGWFATKLDDAEIRARTVILATGVEDNGSAICNWAAGVRSGNLRLCPVCDAFEMIDRKVAILARPDNAVEHALFLRRYTTNVTLVNTGEPGSLSQEGYVTLADRGITLIENSTARIAVDSEGSAILRVDGEGLRFDAIYPMVGCHPRTGLGHGLGAKCSIDGEIVTDEFQQTTVPGLFAAGDVVSGLNQISVAIGHAAIAASHINYLLLKLEEPVRQRQS